MGTDIIMHIKPDTDEENYDRVSGVPTAHRSWCKKYSDYIRYPIRHGGGQDPPEGEASDAGEDYKPEWETVKEWKTLNSMVPLWQRQKSRGEAGGVQRSSTRRSSATGRTP